MSRKSTWMRKEQEILAAQAAAAAVVATAPAAVPVSSNALITDSVHNDEAGDSSDDDEIKLGDDGKPRISWDRNVRGDKNGLKTVLMNMVYDHKFHVEGKMKENFKLVSGMLSVEGGKFERFNGIAASGAQRKYNNILRDVAKTFKIGEVNEIVDETDAEAFEVVTLKVLRDLVEREKAKKGQKVKRDVHEGSADGTPAATSDETEADLGFINKKRRSDVIALRNAVRSAAGTLETPVVNTSSSSNATGAAESSTAAMSVEGEDDEHTPSLDEEGSTNGSRVTLKINRLDKIKHEKAVEALKTKSINTVDDLFKAAAVSQASWNVFPTVSGIKVDRPVDRFLKLYEEVAADNEFVSKMRELTGMTPGDILDVEAVIRPLY